MKKWKCFSDFIRCIKDVFYPRHCIYCDKTINSFKALSICSNCTEIKIYPKVVRDDRYLFKEAFGVLKYEGVVREAMLKFKFKSIKYYGYTFADRINLYRESFPYLNTSVLCCVPISNSREREYNQTEVIAKHLADMLGKECITDLLFKVRDIRPLSSMDKAQRKIFIRGAFEVNPKYDILGKDVVVIDDIFTSGTTANECARILLSAGAQNVYFACACYD